MDDSGEGGQGRRRQRRRGHQGGRHRNQAQAQAQTCYSCGGWLGAGDGDLCVSCRALGPLNGLNEHGIAQAFPATLGALDGMAYNHSFAAMLERNRLDRLATEERLERERRESAERLDRIRRESEETLERIRRESAERLERDRLERAEKQEKERRDRTERWEDDRYRQHSTGSWQAINLSERQKQQTTQHDKLPPFPPQQQQHQGTRPAGSDYRHSATSLSTAATNHANVKAAAATIVNKTFANPVAGQEMPWALVKAKGESIEPTTTEEDASSALRHCAETFKEGIRETANRRAKALGSSEQLSKTEARAIIPALVGSNDRICITLGEALSKHEASYTTAKQMLRSSSPEAYVELVAAWAVELREQWSAVETQLSLKFMDEETQACLEIVFRVMQAQADNPQKLLDATNEDDREEVD